MTNNKRCRSYYVRVNDKYEKEADDDSVKKSDDEDTMISKLSEKGCKNSEIYPSLYFFDNAGRGDAQVQSYSHIEVIKRANLLF